MTLTDLAQKYQQELHKFFTHFPLPQLEEVFNSINACQGLVFFSGVGKSALVAQKMAVTLTATGTRALFIAPLEAMHGDVGLVTSQDLFIAISKSGETDELLHLLPYVRNKGAKTIAFTSKENSRLAHAADLKLVINTHNELCPFNMAPTVSTTCHGIIGDILAVAMMKKKQFSIDAYAMNHPGGTIGKRVTTRVKDLMLQEDKLPLCSPDDLLLDVLEILSEKRAGCLLITKEDRTLLGIFTDGDLRRSLQKKGGDILKTPMGDLMTFGGRTIGSEALAWEALKVMENLHKSPIMVLPVVDETHHVVGLIKMHDILQSGI